MFNDEQEFNRLIANLPTDAQVDPAHREALRRRVLEQFAQARQAARPGRLTWRPGLAWRLPTMFKRIGIAAGFVAAAAGLTLAVWLAGRPEIALADVQRKLAAVRVVAFHVEVFRPGVTDTDYQAYVTEDSVARFETPDYTTLIDWQRGRMLALMHATREAIEGDVRNLQDNPYHRNWLVDLRRIVGSENARYLGAKVIDGVHAVGWQVDDGDWIVTVWASADTAELVRVEFQKDQLRMAFSRFRYDVDIDSALFSLAPPAGYTVLQVTMDANKVAESDVVLVLRIWAMSNGDVFPDSLDSWKFSQATGKVDWRRVKEYAAGKSSAEISQSIGQAFWWLNAKPGWSYVGAGVRLGDADTAVFWYKPDGSSTYRVIYGDLHVAEETSPPSAK